MASDAHDRQFHLADEHLRAGRAEDALAIFAALLHTDLDDFGKAMACLNMGIIHAQLGRVDEAIRAYDTGVLHEQRCGGINLLQRKAAYCAEAGRHEQALATLSVLERSPIPDLDKARACLDAAVSCEALGQSGKALHWYDLGIRYERPHHRFHVAEHLAWYHASKGRNAESRALYEALLREPSQTEADKARLRQNIAALGG